MNNWLQSGLFFLLKQQQQQQQLSATATAAITPSISGVSRVFGLDRAFHSKLLYLLELGYKCRLRLPLIISSSFILLHVFSNYVPRVEINVEVVENQEIVVEAAEAEPESQSDEEEEEVEEANFEIEV